MAEKSAVDRLREALYVAKVVGGRAAQCELDAARKQVQQHLHTVGPVTTGHNAQETSNMTEQNSSTGEVYERGPANDDDWTDADEARAAGHPAYQAEGVAEEADEKRWAADHGYADDADDADGI